MDDPPNGCALEKATVRAIQWRTARNRRIGLANEAALPFSFLG